MLVIQSTRVLNQRSPQRQALTPCLPLDEGILCHGEGNEDRGLVSWTFEKTKQNDNLHKRRLHNRPANHHHS